jgi:ABC-2 type transport system ATP-binding protein
MTAEENLIYTARLMGIPRSEREARIATSLARVRLGEVAPKKVGTFSRGMKQRLGIAELLMKRAEIVILDEPTSGLDPQSTAELLTMIRGLKQDGVTVLLSSHQLDQVQSICDRVALFNAGRIALLGAVPELARQVLGGGMIVDVEARGIELGTALATVPGVTGVEQISADHFRLRTDRDIRPEAAAVVVAAGGRLTRLAVEEASLDTVYTRYFAKLAVKEEQAHAA